MAPSLHPKQLIVEGHDDLFSITGLIQAHVNWPQRIEDVPVFINLGSSVEEILKPANLSPYLKSGVIKTFGIIIDADVKPAERYQSLLRTCGTFFPAMPPTLPKEGMIVNSGPKRLGIWIMPDNSSEGMLETFLRRLVPPNSSPLWDHAERSTVEAKKYSAQYRECHTEKAHLYSWLAWHDPPSQKPGMALRCNMLDPKHADAAAFAKWFIELFDLTII